MGITIGKRIRVSIITEDGEELEVLTTEAGSKTKLAMDGFNVEQIKHLLNASYYLKRAFDMLPL